MAGVYIHIPFCGQLCSYCDFHFSVSKRGRERVVEAMLREMELRRDYLAGERAETLYFGGGTPSLLPVDTLELLARRAAETFGVTAPSEFTVEANPEDLTPEYLHGLRRIGADRLSIGVQSFVERDLKMMNRRHDARRAVEAVREAQRAGFGNISVDLIYGVPGLTDAEWRSNLRRVFSLGVQHFSAYHLTVEPQTPLGVAMRKGKFRPVEEAVSEAHYAILEEEAAGAGFEHYEVSNFARPGFRALHNSNYWSGKRYIGIGPSAHSFDGASRCWNIAGNNRYADLLLNGAEGWSEREELTADDRFNERVMTGLRRAEGIRFADFGEPYRSYLERESVALAEKGLLTRDAVGVRIETRNFLLSDHIIAALFKTED